jgi:hypothetical protein
MVKGKLKKITLNIQMISNRDIAFLFVAKQYMFIKISVISLGPWGIIL